MIKKCLLFFLFLGHAAIAQYANDCTSAIVVCGNSNIVSNASGFGTQELDNTTNPCSFEELNSLWLELNISESGLLSFEIKPESADLAVDYDFYIFGPGNTCGNFDDPIRCSTTNPLNAGLNYNTTGLKISEMDSSEGPGADGNSFVSALPVVQGETYFLLVDRPHGSGGFDLNWTGSSQFFEPPVANEPTDISICLGSSITTVDLSQKAQEITTETSSKLLYFNTYADAFDGKNAIKEPTTFQLADANTPIFVKVSSQNGCFEIRDFNINVDNYLSPSPSIELALCDQNEDGMEDFNLNLITPRIEDNLTNPADVNITYHAEEHFAENNSNFLNSNSFVSTNTTIYARLSTISNVNCFLVLPVPLEVISSPIPLTAQLLQCDIDQLNSTDGITAFNLEQIFLGIPNPQDYTFYFYENLTALNNNNPITNTIGYVNNTPFIQDIYFTAEHLNVGCTSVGEIQLQVQPTTISLNPQSPFFACDDLPDDGALRASFNLDNISAVNYPNLEATFYASLEDVSLELNPLSGIYTTESTKVYVRIENSNQCQGVEEVVLTVNPLPQFTLEETYVLCTDGTPLTINAPSGFNHYRWLKITGSSALEVSLTQDLTPTESGTYELEIGISYAHMTETLVCTRTKRFTISPSNRAVIQDVIIEDNSTNNTVEIVAGGDGIYEYALDGLDYQDNPLFSDVNAGFRTVFIRDKNGCGISKTDISVIGYPKFFTPNADGINDFWQISGINDEIQSNSVIYIYDRYGKLLAQLKAETKGWNGFYNNQILPSADYWFKAMLEDGREFNGHFALKR